MREAADSMKETGSSDGGGFIPLALVGAALMLFLFFSPGRLPDQLQDGAGHAIERISPSPEGGMVLLHPTALGMVGIWEGGQALLVAPERVQPLQDFPPQATAVQASPLGLWVGTRSGLHFVSDGRSGPARGIEETRGEPIGALALGGGFLWVGAGARLLRFDGETWQPVDGLRLPAGRSIRALLWQEGQGLWIGNEDGLGRLVEGRYEVVALPGGAAAGTVNDLGSLPDGRLIVIAGGRCFSMFDGRWSIEAGLPGGLRCLAVSEGRAWVGGPNVLAVWKGGRFESVDAFPPLELRRLAWDGTRLWMATAQGLWRYAL